ncbi:MAG: YdjY domain-containing protein [Planctomycetota bacterium]
MESCPTQAVLPLVGLAAEKVIPERDKKRWATIVWCVLLLSMLPATLFGEQKKVEAEARETPAKPKLPFQPGKKWVPLTQDHEVWMQLEKKRILVGGRVCLNNGMLEMFACPKGTKEHEAIVAVNTPARYVHAGLVALGAEPGPPVQFRPVYRPAQGTEIEVKVIWKDQQGEEHRARAREWIKNTKTGKVLQSPWVFAGSGFWTDEETGERFYYADGGEFICVSNFSTAMLDLPLKSSDANSNLVFSAFTERIPPIGTRVFLELTPKLKSEQSTEPSPANGKQEKKKAAKQTAPTEGEETGEATKPTKAQGKRTLRSGQKTCKPRQTVG